MKIECEEYIKTSINIIIEVIKDQLGCDNIPDIFISDLISECPSAFITKFVDEVYDMLPDKVYNGVARCKNTNIAILLNPSYYDTYTDDMYIMKIDILNSIAHELMHYKQYSTNYDKFMTNMYDYENVSDAEYGQNILEKEAEYFADEIVMYCMNSIELSDQLL